MKTNNVNKRPATSKKKSLTKKKAPTLALPKKKSKKLTRAEYDDLRQIDWVPFDPYAD